MMVAASWDLRTEAVTLGFGVYTPYNDGTRYASAEDLAAGKDSGQLQRLSARYHAITDQTIQPVGHGGGRDPTAAGLFFGGGLSLPTPTAALSFLRDLGDTTQPGEAMVCPALAGAASRDGTSAHRSDVNGWGYGFTTGLLSEVLEDRLWLGISYLSPP